MYIFDGLYSKSYTVKALYIIGIFNTFTELTNVSRIIVYNTRFIITIINKKKSLFFYLNPNASIINQQ